MSKITYKVIKHDGGWAYEANGAHSQTFQTREAARNAAKLAATARATAGGTTPRSYEDEAGQWFDNSG